MCLPLLRSSLFLMKLGVRKEPPDPRNHNTLLGIEQGQGMQSFLGTKIKRNCLQISYKNSVTCLYL